MVQEVVVYPVEVLPGYVQKWVRCVVEFKVLGWKLLSKIDFSRDPVHETHHQFGLPFFTFTCHQRHHIHVLLIQRS